MTPQVSVVIATYNYARYLPAALESALGQTFADIEVNVVDDGSTDGTYELIQRYLDDPRVRYLPTDHVGHPAAKNIGIRSCRAPLVAFLDADDVWMPTKLEKQVALFHRHPELGVVYTRRTFINELGEHFERRELPVYRGNILEEMLLDNFVCFSSSMVSKVAFDEHGILDESVPDNCDYELWLRIARTFSFDYVDEPLVQYRTGHSNMTHGAGAKRLLKVVEIMDRFLDEYGGRTMVSRSVIRRAYAETYCHLAEMLLDTSRSKANRYYFRSLSRKPFRLGTWYSMANGLVPRKVKRALKSVFPRGGA